MGKYCLANATVATTIHAAIKPTTNDVNATAYADSATH